MLLDHRRRLASGVFNWTLGNTRTVAPKRCLRASSPILPAYRPLTTSPSYPLRPAPTVAHTRALLQKGNGTHARPYSAQLKMDKPTYQLTFTCKACDERSTHLVSKQAYHNGTVLVQCPSCKNRHLIADNLKIFEDKKTTLEDILARKGESITKGSIDPNEISDLEWEPDGTLLTASPKLLDSENSKTE